MNKARLVIIIAAICMAAICMRTIPALAVDHGCSWHASSRGRCEATDIFQAASDTIDGFHPKPCLLQPMKPWGPADREKTGWFQSLADSIKGK